MAGLPKPGEVFGRYEILRRIGRGGMGVVYAARQIGIDREVALKVLSADLADSESYRNRFTREAMVLGRIDSPNVIHVYEAGEHEGWLFIATQLIEGGDLRQRMDAQGPLDPATAVDLVIQVATGLRDAHKLGILHRDIKPSNVLLRDTDEGLRAYLCDLGIATVEDVEHTRTVGAIGTLGYMAPERHEGRDATVATDIYALGCLLWAALVGEAPYVGTDFSVAAGHLRQPVRQLDVAMPNAAALNPVLARTMAKDPGDRYPDASALLAELRAASARIAEVDGPRGAHVVVEEVTQVRPVPTGETELIVSSRADEQPPEPAWTFTAEPDAATITDRTIEETDVGSPSLTPAAASPPRAKRWVKGTVSAAVLLLIASAVTLQVFGSADDTESGNGDDPVAVARVGSETVSRANLVDVADFFCDYYATASADGADLRRSLAQVRFELLGYLLDALVVDQSPTLRAAEQIKPSDYQDALATFEPLLKKVDSRRRELIVDFVRRTVGAQVTWSRSAIADIGQRKVDKLSQSEATRVVTARVSVLRDQAYAAVPVAIDDEFDTNRDDRLTDADEVASSGRTCGSGQGEETE